MNTPGAELFLPCAVWAALAAGREIMDVYAGADFGVETKADRSPLTIADRRAHRVISAGLAASGLPVLSEEGRDVPFEERRGWLSFWLVDPLDGTKEFIKRNGEFTVNIALIQAGTPVLGVVYAPALGDLYTVRDKLGAYKIEAGHLKEGDFGLDAIIAAGERLPAPRKDGVFRIVASRSHMTPETLAYVEAEKAARGDVELVSKGSSLKLCLVAEGAADVYPRFGPTMEWDTAAGDAVARASGCLVTQADGKTPLVYNKEDLHNPWFIVRRPDG
jgi:3'(2'), 5'-bisphosphate nucleotidase